MVTTRRYSWHVKGRHPEAGDKKTVNMEVTSDEVEVAPDGSLIFWHHASGVRAYASLIIAPGQWDSAVIQSALTGYQNGFSLMEKE